MPNTAARLGSDTHWPALLLSKFCDTHWIEAWVGAQDQFIPVWRREKSLGPTVFRNQNRSGHSHLLYRRRYSHSHFVR